MSSGTRVPESEVVRARVGVPNGVSIFALASTCVIGKDVRRAPGHWSVDMALAAWVPGPAVHGGVETDLGRPAGADVRVRP